jgi:Ca-activated chloride channel family protein
LLDKLDRSEISGQSVLPELYAWLLWPALALLVLDVVLRSTRLRRFP